MKYRDLQISFSIEEAWFSVLSICLEKLIQPIPKHSHSKNSFELHYISYGAGKLITESGSYTIKSGSLFMTGPGVEHEQLSDSKNPMTEYCIYMKLDSSEKTAGSLVHSFLEKSFWFGEDDHRIHDLMKQIFFELETRDSGFEFILPSLLQQVVVQMVRRYEKSETQQVPEAKKQLPADQTYLTIEEAFLYDYYDLTLKSLSKRINLSERQTERLLKKHYSKTFLQKKTEARMFAACTMLREGKVSISDIAFSLGFSSVEHFSNSFRHQFCITPSLFRKNATQLFERS